MPTSTQPSNPSHGHLPKTMRAIHIPAYVQDYTSLKPTSIPLPTLKPGHILIRITHTSPTHVDLLYSKGLHQNNHSGLISPPFTLGIEFAGIVISSRPDDQQPSHPQCPHSGFASSRFRAGDKVWGSSQGSFAEYITVPSSSSTVHHIPRSWTCHMAAGLGASNAPVSYGALVRCAELKAGETVLVHAAAGGLGVTACQIARAMGCNVIGTVGSEAKAAVIRRLWKRDGKGEGVQVVRYDLPDWEGEVKRLTGGARADVVYDTVGLVERSIRCLKFGGRIVVAGFVGREGEIERVRMNRVLLKNVKVLGYRYGETGRRDSNEHKIIWEGLNSILETGNIRPVVYKTYHGLESVPEAMQELKDRKVYGKVVIEVADEKLVANPESAKL